MSNGRDDLRVVEGGEGHDDAPEPMRSKKSKAKKAKKADDSPPPAGDDEGEDRAVAFAPLDTEDAASVMVTRKLPPQGHRGPCDTGFAGYIASDDLRVILERIENTWKGGVYKLDFFKGGRPTGATREVEVSGEPLPLRPDDDDDLYVPPPYGAPGYGPPPFAGPPPYGAPPYGPPPGPTYGYPAGVHPTGDRWRPPATSAEDELREELEKLKREREEEKARKERDEWARKLEERLKPQGPNPMDQYFQLMQQQAAEDRARRDRERAEERERRDREDRERRDREEREERRREEERKERAAQEERERQRREEERREREAREERFAQEQRQFMQSMAKQNSPENMLAILTAFKGLAAPPTDPLAQVTQLLEVTQMVRETAGVSGGDDDEGPKGVLGALAKLAGGVGAYFEAKSTTVQPQDAAGVQQPQQIPMANGQQQAPRQQPQPKVSAEARIGRFVLLLKCATDAYKTGNDPEDAAKALVGYAISLRDQGYDVTADLKELGQIADMPADQIAQMLVLLQAQITNQVHAAHVKELQGIVATPDGANWIKATLAALHEAVS